MSAAAWDPSFAPSGRGPASVRRPHLTLIEGGRGVATTSRIRLTRWGRLAITLSVLVVAITVATSLMSSAASPTAVPTEQVTVQAGQTLSEIAAVALPGVPVRDAVAKIAIANDLPNHHVNAGQVLVVPIR